MHAVIVDGIVAELHPAAPALDVGESAIIVECGDEVRVGWRLEAGALVPPPPAPEPDLNAEIDARILALEAAQHRATRELLLELGAVLPDEARARLAEIDAQIAALRAQRTMHETPGV